MFRTFARKFLPNPFDTLLKRTAKKGGRSVLIAWNRGLGDLALGLYAMIQRIREIIPAARIVFLARENLLDGFRLLEGVEAIGAPWKRGESYDVKETLRAKGIDPADFDLIIERPSPTDWVRWQRGKVVPRLKWNEEWDLLCEKFSLPRTFLYVGVQVSAETNYGLWRNWPLERWQELFSLLEKKGNVRVILFGFGASPQFSHSNIVDLRGKTTLYEMLSLIKNRCYGLILPDSGILSMAYYLDVSFPLRVISLWADPEHGILKQAVDSPNPQLEHCPLIGENRDLSTVSPTQVLQEFFPRKPLKICKNSEEIEAKPVQNAACILLAGGQGTRLGTNGPKGLFQIAGKSLFQWHCEKIKAQDAPLAVMTSPLNHAETVAFFEQNSYFGLEVHFFQQEMQPLLDEQKNPIEIRPNELALGPNGNGSLFRSFKKAGLGELFQKKGIDLVTVIPVENPLAQPFDPRLIAYHRSEKAEATIKCIERRDTDAAMGVLEEMCDSIHVREYTEILPEEMKQYRYANIGQMAFGLSFFSRMADVDLPLHWVRKKIAIGGQSIWVWKGEQFLFDALPFSLKTRALCSPRENCYAPLKSKENILDVEKAVRFL